MQEEGWGEAVATGTPLGDPPLIAMISADPVLKGTRLIAEAWDAGGLYQVTKTSQSPSCVWRMDWVHYGLIRWAP